VRLFAAALWWGSLTTVCFLIAPLLFVYLPTPAMAGNLAAKLFTVQAWVSIACGLVLLWGLRADASSGQVAKSQSAMLFVVLGMLLGVLVEFAIAPRIVARENLRLWHGIGVLLYALQWCCAALVLWKTALRSESAS
jgi:hypothetical protein